VSVVSFASPRLFSFSVHPVASMVANISIMAAMAFVVLFMV